MQVHSAFREVVIHFQKYRLKLFRKVLNVVGAEHSVTWNHCRQKRSKWSEKHFTSSVRGSTYSSSLIAPQRLGPQRVILSLAKNRPRLWICLTIVSSSHPWINVSVWAIHYVECYNLPQRRNSLRCQEAFSSMVCCDLHRKTSQSRVGCSSCLVQANVRTTIDCVLLPILDCWRRSTICYHLRGFDMAWNAWAIFNICLLWGPSA